MAASPDDAAASDVPPRADAGPAAPSFPGTPDRRPPEDRPVTQHSPPHDETVRMPADGRRPHLAGVRPTVPTASGERPGTGERPEAAEPDETRPVTRDWLLGAPPAESAATAADDARDGAGAETGADWSTE